jgi:tetratricopeptide (TPR) repeat protein
MPQIGVSKPYYKTLLLAGVIVLTCAYGYYSAQTYRASRYGNQVSEATLHAALTLEPGNAEFHDRLGQYYFHAHQDAVRAAKEYRVAVTLNPHNAYYWLNLASAYEVLDNRTEQERAITAACRTGPSTPDVLWTAANLYLVRGDVERGVPLLRRVLEVYAGTDYQAMSAAVSLSWRATHDVDLILQRILPPRADVHVAFLYLLVSNGEVQKAHEVWERIVELGQPVEVRFLFGYIDALLQINDADQARRVWSQLTSLNPELGGRVSSDNLVFNGGLEQPALNGGLDWRIQPHDSVAIAADTSQFHGGTQSLRITFNGEALSDAGVLQYVPVKPGARYVFTAYMRAEDVWTQSGPRFQVRDARSGTQYFLGEDVIGSAYWRESSGHFITGPDTHLLAVSIVRNPSGSRIKGTIWIDDISLRQE